MTKSTRNTSNGARRNDIYRIYVTNTGKTASQYLYDFLVTPTRLYDPDHIIVLASSQLVEDLKNNTLNITGTSYDIAMIKSPIKGNADYFDVLGDIAEKIKNKLTDQKHMAKHPELIINCSGGTTKMMYILSDLAVLLSPIINTRLVWGAFDEKERQAIYTEKPELPKELKDYVRELSK